MRAHGALALDQGSEVVQTRKWRVSREKRACGDAIALSDAAQSSGNLFSHAGLGAERLGQASCLRGLRSLGLDRAQLSVRGACEFPASLARNVRMYGPAQNGPVEVMEDTFAQTGFVAIEQTGDCGE